VRHVVRLVDDLLDVSRITRGKIELHREPIELAPVVARAVEMASPLLESRAHHLDIEVAANGLAIDGDALRLAQVLANLVNNSARYTPPDGHIVVRARREADRIVISVRDDGPGIAPDMLEKIFEPFIQADRPPGAGGGGLGLGLPLARSIVALHGGTIVAQSEGKGTGTEVVVELPALHPARTVRPPTRDRRDSPWAGAGSARILIVDDNQDAAELLAMGFEALGYEVRTAADGPRALDIAVSFRPQACAVDIGLPVMDGYEVGARLRAILGEEVRLVAVSGYGQTRDRQKSLEAGFVEHLVKPVDLRTLVRALHPS
jgi:CheY-like chemotaxis protein